MMDAAARRRLAGVLAKLPRRQRQAFLAAAICGLSNAQIAMRLHTDIATVDELLAAALVALDEAFQ